MIASVPVDSQKSLKIWELRQKLYATK